MKTIYRLLSLAFLFLPVLPGKAQTVQKCDQICGKWMSEEKNLTVLVYKNGDEFKGKIVWFRDDPSLPMEQWRDSHNPDPKLRSRKVLGMDVLHDLKYDADNNSWEDGIVYDAKHGKDWNASVYIDKQGLLRVRGYWHFNIFGKTMTFKRV
jgi:uncharacterized protein (DUF2147 family)